MHIRRAVKSDYKELMRLYAIFAKNQRYLKPDNDAFYKVIKDANSVVYVATEGAKLIGFITFHARFVVRYRKPIGQVEELFVLKKFRKQGIGKKLIEKTEKTAKKFKCNRLYIESRYRLRPAHRFYKSLGYVRSGYYFKKEF